MRQDRILSPQAFGPFGSATQGALSFSTPAPVGSLPGVYPIFGSGLKAQNYVFSQAQGNAQALTIVDSAPGVEALIANDPKAREE